MPDRELVICHLNDCMEASRQDYTWVFVRTDIVEDAIELLKEQRPTGKWIVCKASIHPYAYDVKCSVCGHRMGSSFGYKFCPECGADMR